MSPAEILARVLSVKKEELEKRFHIILPVGHASFRVDARVDLTLKLPITTIVVCFVICW